MKINPFELERYFAKYEFTSKYLLSSSDCESLSLHELMQMADAETHYLWENLKLGYTESSGHPKLKAEIVKLYHSISADEINVMVPEEGIFVAMNCMLERGDHVISTFPGYQSLFEIANSMGCEVSKWAPQYQKGWQFNIAELESLIQKNTKLIVINFPHNPTGATISKENLLEIISLCKQSNILLFSDEMYRFLEYTPKDQLPSASDLYENAISLFGLSKSFALPGLRIGWLTSKNKRLMQEIASFKDYTTICNNAPSEILSIIALRNKDKIFKRNLKIILENLETLNLFFRKHKTMFEWCPPKAGPIAFPGLKTELSVQQFCIDLVEQKSVMLLPSSVYKFAGNYFRIGFARKNMKEALVNLENYILEKQKITGLN
ncbi:aminotransferase class I/II-fold pyridoxal phosphate-dependent enzyme [Maribellus maritimus]|uniref:aminotransferase class I/II-fold pyridoxal phosphate-dependent enzyme n=1 Tax=Maribellus maritimus TaxID=2870838 RepID=UPI001EEC770D|nr:aminotransferase class I/II-fold pyridoxal phosphate-dependent enzyme [Maribellus maritimus]MCG6190817.1 aminotransferase class I/II-fold pyridoxal phosphate-dependent enzyme [Maribellus maritimus]